VINPLFAASMTSFIGCIIPFILLIRNKALKIIFKKENLKELLLIGFFGTVMTYALFFSGAKLTTGINTAILLQVEPIYSILLSFFILKEKVTVKQVLATLLIVVGIVAVVYNVSFSFNLGDLFILLTPLFYQLSHVISKKVINKYGTYAIQSARYFYGGIMLLVISTLFGMNQFNLLTEFSNLSIILALGIIVAGIGTLSFYESIKRINLSKTTALISPYSVIGVILAWLVLKETPTLYQIIGLILILFGIFALTKIRSEKRIK
jgi:drug/metabolite transporter (DMT)-like permease